MLLVIPPRPNPKNTDPGLGSIPFIRLLIRDEMIDSIAIEYIGQPPNS
jgi:hypothetical protein